MADSEAETLAGEASCASCSRRGKTEERAHLKVWKWFVYHKSDQTHVNSVYIRYAAVNVFVTMIPYEKAWGHHECCLMAKDMIPVRVVEKAGFRKGDPMYQLLGWNFFSQTALSQLYDEYWSKLEAALIDAKYFATAKDLRSSSTSEPHIRKPTVHLIDVEWNLHSKCLQTVNFLETPAAEIISLVFKKLDSLTSLTLFFFLMLINSFSAFNWS